MTAGEQNQTVLQLRVALTTGDFERTVAFYRDTIGMVQLEAFMTPDGDGVVLDAGSATLEILDEQHAAHVDTVEVGARVAPRVRLAFEVGDTTAVTTALVAGGATLLGGPTTTPWESVNSRLEGPEGVQLTIFSDPR